MQSTISLNVAWSDGGGSSGGCIMSFQFLLHSCRGIPLPPTSSGFHWDHTDILVVLQATTQKNIIIIIITYTIIIVIIRIIIVLTYHIQ